MTVEFKATIASGTYRVRISDDTTFSYNSKYERVYSKIATTINVGDSKGDCVQISVPVDGTIAHMLWLESAIGCRTNIEAKIKGEETINMAQLAITLTKEINSSISHIKLQDNASFTCNLPEGKKSPINMTAHDIVFYQQSYYEKRYGATLIDPEYHSEYIKHIKNFSNPDKKPPVFNFRNKSLTDGLNDLYLSTETWKEFFDGINTTYGDDKCTVIYPWINDALAIIFEDMEVIGRKWIFKIKPEQIIPYSKQQSAGGRKTQRVRELYLQEEKTPSPPQLAEMDFSRFFKKNSR